MIKIRMNKTNSQIILYFRHKVEIQKCYRHYKCLWLTFYLLNKKSQESQLKINNFYYVIFDPAAFYRSYDYHFSKF